MPFQVSKKNLFLYGHTDLYKHMNNPIGCYKCFYQKKKKKRFWLGNLVISHHSLILLELWKSQCVWQNNFLSPRLWVTAWLFLFDSSRLWTLIWLLLMYHLRWVGKVLVRGCLADKCASQAMKFWTKAWFEYGMCRYYEMFLFFFSTASVFWWSTTTLRWLLCTIPLDSAVCYEKILDPLYCFHNQHLVN